MTLASKENETLPFWMKGVFAPVKEELEVFNLKVIGDIPKELNGRYFRNGANPRASISPDGFVTLSASAAIWFGALS